MVLNRFKEKICLLIQRIKWKYRNRHNDTHIISIDGDSIDAVTAGQATYGGIYVLAHACKSRLTIGSFCSIAPRVTFVLGSEHPVNKLSSFPFQVKYLGIKHEADSKGDIIIDDDVWIGYGATIMSGVHLGQGSVVAAGALVTKDVSPYAIVGGVPARTIKYRFDQSIIEYLVTLDYNKLDKTLIRKHKDDLLMSIDTMEVKEISEHLRWFPKK